MRKVLGLLFLFSVPYVASAAEGNVFDTLHTMMLSGREGKAIDSLGNERKMEEACTLARRAHNDAGVLLACGVWAFFQAADRQYGGADSTYTYLMGVLKGAGLSRRLSDEYVWKLSDMLGFAFLETGNYAGAVRYYEAALKRFRRSFGDTLYEGYAHNRIGMAYHRAGNYGKAKEHYRKALKLLKDRGEMAARVHNNLGMLYYALKEYGRALEHLKRAEELIKGLGGKADDRLSYIYANMADVYEAMGEDGKAREYRRRAEEIRKRP